MLPLKQRLEALGLILFVDVDGRLDGEATFPEALDKGVRAAKAVLGCWSPWALTRPWVQTECAIGKDQNKLVAVERIALSTDDVPALFYLVDRKPLADFTGDAPHEGWAMTLTALATKLRLWTEKNPSHTDVNEIRAKADVLEKAAQAERAGLAKTQPSPSWPVSTSPTAATASAAEQAWVAIERSVEASHYRRFEKTFESDAVAFVRVIEAEARVKAIERWQSTDKSDPDAIAEAMRTGLFPALQEAAQAALKSAEENQRARVALRSRPGSAWRDATPGLAESASPEMVTIPPGKFLMGSPKSESERDVYERPQHDVRIDYAFALGKHAVTFAEWDAAIAAGAKLEKPSDEGWGRDRRPVINVSWNDAKAYLAWLNNKLGLEGRTDAYRLPSEAEWEYACRAGTTTPFSFGATISTAQAQFSEGSAGSAKQTVPVGSFPANAFGLHDMHGNVWEWCEDVWNDNYNGAPADGSARLTGDASSRVLRGGSWYDSPENLRSADRYRGAATNGIIVLGFRVARTL